MTAAQVLETLRARGGQLHLLAGDHLGVAPASALTDDLRTEIRAHSVELVRALQRESSQPPQTPARPADALDHDWRGFVATSRQRLAEHGVKRDQETLEGAAWLHLQLETGRFPRPGITEAAARRLLEAVYAGRLVARITDDARVVLRESIDGQQKRPVALEGAEE